MARYLEANFRALSARDPATADAVGRSPGLPAAIERAASGQPTVLADGVLLHSRHDPVAEAAAWAARERERLGTEATTAVVLGFGLGYHVEALAALWRGRLVVVEPDRRMLRTALETRDLQALLARIELAPEPLAREVVGDWGAAVVLPHGPSLLRGAAGLRASQELITARGVLGGRVLRVLVVSPLGGGSHPLAGHCARALAELGHDVTLLDLSRFAGAMEAIGRIAPRRTVRAGLEASYIGFLGEVVLAAVDASGPDLLLALAQAPLTPPVLAEIARRGVVRAFWFVEDHRLMTYWRDVIGAYDWFFAIQQGEFLDEAGRLSGSRARYLPCAADPAVHRPLALAPGERERWGASVAFVGAGYRNRRLAFRALLDLGLKVWGSDWGEAGPLAPAIQQSGVRITTDDAVRIFNATAVNLNLHSSAWLDGVDPRGDFVNPRTFEIAAAGGFQLVDRRALLPAHFTPDVELATFGDAAELRDLVRHWLARPEERAAMAAAARERVLREHTYRHRMEVLLETVCAGDATRLLARQRVPTVGEVARAEGDTSLGALLRRLPPALPFALEDLTGAVLAGRDALAESEAMLLFLHEFDDLYVREHRA